MLSPKTKRNILQIIPFGLLWLFFSTVYLLLERGLLGKLNYYPATGNPYNFSSNVAITPLTALITGLLMGIIEVLYINQVFIHKSFTKKILYKSFIYLVIILFFLIGLTLIGNKAQLHTSITDARVWNNMWQFFISFSFWSVVVFIAAIIGISLFYNEVSNNLGHAVLINFFSGKYHTPKEEERIFMFLDMKSSTTIAEHIGHLKYFDMLRTYYADLSDPIIAHSGEIYQYVGDEIVVSWKLVNGLQNNNCIRCFFAIREAIARQDNNYRQQFGITPQFKAGFHLGKVTTGEIGVIKKEIIFTGDTLNTTARIQSLCNAYHTDMLVSNHLLQKLSLPSHTRVTPLGETELRGRDEKIKLFTISQID